MQRLCSEKGLKATTKKKKGSEIAYQAIINEVVKYLRFKHWHLGKASPSAGFIFILYFQF